MGQNKDTIICCVIPIERNTRMKQISIGISDYKTIIDKNAFYIDKTLLIKELDESGAGIVLFPRPRRFGKTLNLSMLQYFYEKTSVDHSYLFEKSAIWQHEKYRSEQGQWPIIPNANQTTDCSC